MRLIWKRLTILCVAALVMPASLRADGARAAGPAKPAEKISFTKEIAPLLKEYCIRCHGGRRPRAGLALDVYKDDAAALKDRSVWEQVAKNVHSQNMPPEGKPHPSSDQIKLLTQWFTTTFPDNDCTGKKDPGRVTIRRLNRTEYNNTIRDLVGIDFRPAQDFPADDVGYGFDNIGDVLSLPPLLMEKYLAAAEKIVREIMATPAVRKRILSPWPDSKNEEECARKIIDSFGRKAYRRPIFPGEMDRLLQFVRLARSQKDGFDKGMELVLEAILTSPHFLFRIETDRAPGNPFLPHPVTDYELATRLSYFLWSSMPDEELFSLAGKRSLRENGNLEKEIQRMLKDPKAHALVENFAGQWLELRNLRNASPDPGMFPLFDETMRQSMRRESELFFETLVKEDRSILDFLDADFTFVNEQLARLYGLPNVRGEEFRRVSLKGTPRGGILTQASVLTVTSNPTRTSPVKRGKWILENILGTPPPPPPPDTPPLTEEKTRALSGTLRQRMEQHRANPNCATCHQRMDPLGFGFENFDAIGGWRDHEGAFSIDASGVLPGGKKFNGPAELKTVLKEKKDEFCRCLAEKMLTYALGRGLESYDKCAVDKICAALAKNNYRFSTLLIEIVKSDPFQMRRGRRQTS
jgi:mono/diheme cytochrome c family protein